MRYLSDVNLRAALTVLITRAGGQVEISNADLYQAMLTAEGREDRFQVEETGTGVRLSVRPAEDSTA